MKLTNTTIAIIASTLVLLVAMIVLLIALGKDATQVITLISTVLIPSVIATVGVQKASRAEKNSAQAVHNTNGRISELIGLLYAHNIPIPDSYRDVKPSVPASVIPDEFKGDIPTQREAS